MKKTKSSVISTFKQELPLHIMILPGLLLIVLFSYFPMVGVIIAFQKFIPAKGLFGDQIWVGMSNFKFIFALPGFQRALINTFTIAFWKIITGLLVPIVFALMLNEVRSFFVKRSVQTIIYVPFFLSWVIMSGVLIDLLSPSGGLVNSVIKSMGFQPIFFLGDNSYFQPTLIITNIWKEFGFGTIVYLAAITGIDPTLYEAAVIDGANRWRQTWHITLPGMTMIIVLMSVLSLGQILNAGFDQIFNLYSPVVYQSGDIIDTFVYRMGLLEAQYGPATAVGLFQSVVSLVFISVSYLLAYKYANYRIF